ncbi:MULTISPECIES: alpha/beta hydrolase [Vagococcus]|uniref:Hydrolases of the alpha/beta superfamily n=1 Tax=Vagococcus fluvialis bH819 TaxID=1255619 RepID=A0A1X6WNP1_9ENTE|nr:MULTISPECIES: alpha/beta hydrolase [Vagococcus]SLM85900.1 Hydrolases of the alpha/beta superfamily [Vagococcus fluvialis bH819]HCM88267.1 alpha/beta hydrolase [Vagococcus sp.]
MKKKLIIIILSLLVLVTVVLGVGVNYLFNYAIVSGEKEFIKSESKENMAKNWLFADKKLETITVQSEDNLRLQAKLITNKKPTNKTVIVAHGYMSEGNAMGRYAQLFYDLGYDVLVPDNRGHGKSEGDYTGFGWLDRKDYVKWIDEIITRQGVDEEIILFGVSMGASTVMMTSGEKLPKQVKAIIADCGYDTVQNELTYQINEMFNLPAFPLIPLTSIYTKLRVGYSFKEASAVDQLKKNKLPLLLIHGDEDDFVPTEFVYKLKEATKGPSELVIFEGAKHGMSYSTNPDKYKTIVSNFLSMYLNK